MKISATNILRSACLVATLLGAAACAAQAAGPAMVGDTAKGKTLVDGKGMSLYTFAKDSDGKSACNGPCEKNWPPLKVTDTAKGPDGYSVVTRDDGSKQWAYKGKPLYTWVHDAKPGDITGDGFMNGAWHLAQP